MWHLSQLTYRSQPKRILHHFDRRYQSFIGIVTERSRNKSSRTLIVEIAAVPCKNRRCSNSEYFYLQPHAIKTFQCVCCVCVGVCSFANMSVDVLARGWLAACWLIVTFQTKLKLTIHSPVIAAKSHLTFHSRPTWLCHADIAPNFPVAAKTHWRWVTSCNDKLLSRTVSSNHCLHLLLQDRSVCEMTYTTQRTFV